jgi:hypothetical protein
MNQLAIYNIVSKTRNQESIGCRKARENKLVLKIAHLNITEWWLLWREARREIFCFILLRTDATLGYQR